MASILSKIATMGVLPLWSMANSIHYPRHKKSPTCCFNASFYMFPLETSSKFSARILAVEYLKKRLRTLPLTWSFLAINSFRHTMFLLTWSKKLSPGLWTLKYIKNHRLSSA